MDKMMLTVMAALITGAAWSTTCDKSLDDFPALPGEDDAARIQRAINTLPKGSLYIPRGECRIDTTLMITNHCSLELNRGAVLKAVKPLPYVVKLNGFPIWKTWNMFFHGGIFANGLYFRCLKKGLAGNIALWAGGNDGSYTDCLAVDWTVGFKITGPGDLSVADCRFSNSKGVEVYRSQPGTRVSWNNNVYRGFGDETECPGPATFIKNGSVGR